MTKQIIDQDMYELLLKAAVAVETARNNAYSIAKDLESLFEDIDNKLSEYDTT